MSKRYLVRLTEGEWADPGRRAATGRGSARELTQPGILKPDDRPTGARLDPRAYRRGAERGPLDRVVELRFVDGRSYTTVRRMLQKNALKPWLTERWCIPPPASGAFVWRMEDYTRPYDPKRPQVCLDEVSEQLLAEQRPTRPPAPGRAKRVDYEYERRGTANLFLCCGPLSGWRSARVTERVAPAWTGRTASRSWWTCSTRRPSGSSWCSKI